MASSQTHPIQKYRNHFSDRTLALVEVLGRDADRDLIRKLRRQRNRAAWVSSGGVNPILTFVNG